MPKYLTLKRMVRSRLFHRPWWRSLILASLGLILSLGIHAQPPVQAEPSIPNPPSALGLVQVGKHHYDAGQFSDAIPLLQQAIAAYAEAGEVIKQAQTLSLLALTYQKLGQWQTAEQEINASLALLDTVPQTSDRVRAQVFNVQGRLQYAQGNAEAALKTWKNAETLYQNVGDTIGSLGSQINQAEAMQALGLYRRTQQHLAQVKQALLTLDDSPLKATGLQNLGNILRQAGDLDESQRILRLSLTVAQQVQLPEVESKTLLNLGNTERTLAQRAQVFRKRDAANNYIQEALTHYEQAARISPSPLTRTQAQLNQFSLLIDTEQFSTAQALLPNIATNLTTLPISRASVYAHVNWAESLMKMVFIGDEGSGMTDKAQQTPNRGQTPNQIAQILATAIKQAEQLDDQRAQSYSLGTLGKLYEKTADWANGIKVTQKALLSAQQINASDIAYQWQWQLGRLLQAQTEVGAVGTGFTDNRVSMSDNLTKPALLSIANPPANPDAIAYYQQAVNTLNSLRSDLVALNPEIQFSFRETVEPVYRQYVDLLLRSPTPSKDNLIQARHVMEALQLAELDNFFRDACATPEAVNIDNLDTQAGIIYPIILDNRLEVIFKLPGQDNLRHYTHPGVSEAQIDAAVEQLQRDLIRRSTSLSQVREDAKTLYDWLIQPLVSDLETATNSEGNPIKTLVFVLDGSLRNIPPAVLYDGEQYLIERYGVAVTPGLQLLEPKPLLAENLQALVAGATEAPSFTQEQLSPLTNVDDELTGITQKISASQSLANQDFLQENIQAQINAAPFNIVHIATHGKFSSNPQETFLLDWNKRIYVNDLDTLLRVNDPSQATPIELLVLSACQTAAGDKRAALGLAGIAVRAGARSTLATLWQVNDASTAQFMLRFYEQLNQPQISKAEALRNTQIAFLREFPNTDFNRPYHWAPFLLVGNWL